MSTFSSTAYSGPVADGGAWSPPPPDQQPGLPDVRPAPGSGRRAGWRRWLPLAGVIGFIAACAIAMLLILGFSNGITGLIIGLGAAILPVPVLVGCFLWLDRYEPEPTRYLVFCFAWGASVATLAALGVNTGVAWIFEQIGLPDALVAVLVAPFIEESMKALGPILLLWRRRREWSGITDGIVYCGLSAIGFAMVENVLYLGGHGYAAGADQYGPATGIQNVFLIFIVRILFTGFAHPLFTSMSGIGLGISSRAADRRVRWLAPIAGLLLAMMLHGTFNLLPTLSAATGQPLIMLYGYLGFMVPLFFAMVGLAITLRGWEGRLTERILPRYVKAGWFSPPEVAALGSLGRRHSARRWARRVSGDAGVKAMRSFQYAATQLALLRDGMQRGLNRKPEDMQHATEEEQRLLTAIASYRSIFVGRDPQMPQAFWDGTSYQIAFPDGVTRTVSPPDEPVVPVPVRLPPPPVAVAPAWGAYGGYGMPQQPPGYGPNNAPPPGYGPGYAPSPGSGYAPGPGSGYAPGPGSGYAPSPGSGYGPGPASGYAPSPGSGYGPGSGSGYAPSPGSGYGPGPGSGYVPSPSSGYAPSPGSGYAPSPSSGYPPSPGPGYAPSPGPGYAPSPGPGYAPSPGPGYAPSPGPGYAPSSGSGYAPSPGSASGPDAGSGYAPGTGVGYAPEAGAQPAPGNPGYGGQPAPGGVPGYGGQPAPGGVPGYGSQPDTGSVPSYGSQPGSGSAAVYGAQLGSGSVPSYGDQPGPGGAPGYSSQPDSGPGAYPALRPAAPAGYSVPQSYAPTGTPHPAAPQGWAPPVYGEPVYGQPVYGQPAQMPAYGQPGYGQPGNNQAAQDVTFTGQPAQNPTAAGQPGQTGQTAAQPQPPASAAQSGYTAQPPYAVQPGYAAGPAHGGEPGYAAGPAYGGQPGYGTEPVTGAQPTHGGQPVSGEPTTPSAPADPTSQLDPTPQSNDETSQLRRDEP